MVRMEWDTLGQVEVPDDVYYGPQTVRAARNFRVSGLKLPPVFIWAQAVVKQASAKANMDAGKLDPAIGGPIIRAASEVREGWFDDQFVVDAFQSGAGTSQNMNANEVIANRALEIMSEARGRYGIIHPNDHVNMSQSSNDTIHTAIHIAAMESLSNTLLPVLTILHEGLIARSVEYRDIVKPGRTHLQDAVPVTLGQEFGGYARMVELGIRGLSTSMDALAELNMGGTAVGTGLNAPEGFGEIAVSEVNRITGLTFRLARDPFEATQGASAILTASSALRSIAVSLIKIANDLRLLSSGPRTGIGEIELPAVQPGSSIMPGKVNPVMAEMLNMACFQVVGNDTVIMMAAQAGQLELNVFTPLMAHNLLGSIQLLSGAVESFTRQCLQGITANAGHCRALAGKSLALTTVLAPKLGYETAADIASRAYRDNTTIRDVVLDSGLLTENEVDTMLDPLRMAAVKK
ncbi:MAG: aspartate ammonia-lyase [ANME-2 cluster archaeon]|nr:aspartate ammonia-lyase [ANME-2 cluster archaeon]